MMFKNFFLEEALLLKLNPTPDLEVIDEVAFDHIRTVVKFLAEEDVHSLIHYQSFLLISF